VQLIENENLSVVNIRHTLKKPSVLRSSRLAMVFPVLAFTLLPMADVSAAEGGPCYKIRRVQIQRLDVFEDAKKEHWYYSLFQALHMTTRESVVRRELLFAVNDCYDADLVAETERNLRSIKIFSEAIIKAVFNEEERVVDLTVVTYDRFTLRVNLGISRKGGINKLRASLGESNFLGLNKDFHYTYISSSDDSRIKRFAYRDPRLTNKLMVDLTYSSTDEGVFQALTIGNPYRRLEQPFAWLLHHSDDQTSSDLYTDGGDSTEIPHNLKTLSLDWSRELGTKTLSKRLGFHAGYHSEGYTETADISIPESTDKLPLFIQFRTRKRSGFTLRTGVDSLIKREDIALHSGFVLGGGGEWRERESGGHLHGLLNAGYSQVDTPTSNQLNASSIEGKVRFYAGEAKTTEFSGFYHHYFIREKVGTWVGGMALNYRFTKDDLYLPLTLGEDRGLRGYEAFTFTGNKLALLNLEHRYTYPVRSLHWGFGQVLFLDGGAAWKPGQSMDPSDLHWGAGLGFRLDNPSILGKKVVRVDLAWPLDGGKPSISFSLGQVFRHDRVNPGFDRDF